MRFFSSIVHILVLAAFIVMCTVRLSLADGLPSALKNRMGFLSQNQAVISKNIANANTPKYKAMELKEPPVRPAGIALATTSPMHISGGSGRGNFKQVQQKDTYETAPDGNNVSIEEQMVKMSKNSQEYQATTNMLRKVHSLINLSTGEK